MAFNGLQIITHNFNIVYCVNESDIFLTFSQFADVVIGAKSIFVFLVYDYLAKNVCLVAMVTSCCERLLGSVTTI